LAFIGLLFAHVYGYGLTKDEVLKSESYDQYYCKDDICVSTRDSDIGYIIIPNKEGVNATYITDTCSTNDIELDLCTSEECSVDADCLSNKCLKGHCTYNEASPIVYCERIRTVHNNPIFGDPYGYKMNCGLPRGDKCKTNEDCSSLNCADYNNNNVCEYPDDSGCTSMCGFERVIFFFIAGAVVVLIVLICICVKICNYVADSKSRNVTKKEYPV